VYPQDRTINFDDDYIEIEFSEYVDKRSVQEAIFISPFIEKTPEFDWTGTTVTITFPEKLKENFTYTITIGTDVVDLNNRNRMAEAFTFAFSTGDKIDTKEISGRIYGKENEGILIYAFRMINGEDTLLKRKPDYISQSGVDGKYSLKGLASGDYRIFAVKDNFRDLIFQSEQDEIGIPFRDISLSETDTLFTNLNFLPFNADTSVSRLVSSTMTDSYHILLTFSVEIASSMIRADNFYIIDSTESVRTNIKYAFKGRTKPEEMVLVVEERITADKNYFLFVDSIINTRDYVHRNDFSTLTVSQKPDSTAPVMISTIPKEKSFSEFVKPEFKFIFDDAVQRENLFNKITFTDTLGRSVNFGTEFPDDATIMVKSSEDLKPEKDYIIRIDLNSVVDAAGNKIDSVYEYRFKTISGMEFTGVSGKILNVNFVDHPVLVLENISNTELTYLQNVTKESFEFKRVEPGKYFLWCFLDADEDKEYNFGWPDPVQNSERFSFYPDTLDLRARWEVTDVIFNFK
jgi:hypothetical protein